MRYSRDLCDGFLEEIKCMSCRPHQSGIPKPSPKHSAVGVVPSFDLLEGIFAFARKVNVQKHVAVLANV